MSVHALKFLINLKVDKRAVDHGSLDKIPFGNSGRARHRMSNLRLEVDFATTAAGIVAILICDHDCFR